MSFKTISNALKAALPKAAYDRISRGYWDFMAGLGKAMDVIHFLGNNQMGVSLKTRLAIVKQYYVVSANVDCPHAPKEILSYVETILSLPPSVQGCVVEAGCFKGGSTAKFSLAAKIAGRQLVVFDSFEGIPQNDEAHSSTAHGHNFAAGEYKGAEEEVRGNIAKYGHVEVCRFIKGWFDDTMPDFKEPVAAVYLDVDLVSSTRTCLKHLYPLLQPGGVLYSQDGHLPLVCDLFDDDQFWEKELGVAKPAIIGLRKEKLIKICKG